MKVKAITGGSSLTIYFSDESQRKELARALMQSPAMTESLEPIVTELAKSNQVGIAQETFRESSRDRQARILTEQRRW